ncbi:ABC transporter substrate-binding protein [Aureimonas sp. AU40]|uniref:ABC transporter substrate-binding protein n=1 Tax=Aureimonas sp. AU40 TaxID=1637747 RepID=UPI000AA15C67|nr:iron-siderophore ABC transporter substrate-binding protein [Aureimonas sp. AU40]
MVMPLSRRSVLAGGLASLALPGPLWAGERARKVVALEWNSTEILLLLGLVPAGVAEREGYASWVSIASDELAAVPDLGRRQQPSLEAISRLQPDLILASAFRHRSIEAELSAIAPTTLIADNPADLDMLAALRAATREIGALVGRAGEADRILADVETRLAGLAERHGAAAASRPLLVAQPLPGVARLRVFTSNAALAQCLARVGFPPPPFAEPQPFGFTTLGLEQLAALPAETHLVLLDAELPPALTASPLWPLLPMMASGHVTPTGGKPWPFGAFGSLMRSVESVVGALR